MKKNRRVLRKKVSEDRRRFFYVYTYEVSDLALVLGVSESSLQKFIHNNMEDIQGGSGGN